MAAPLAATSSIRVVSSRTGIGPHTLRVWERRYGFPKPMRRSDGVRAYAEADIAKLKLIAHALEAGFRAGEVVPLPAADLARLLEATHLDLGERPDRQTEGESDVESGDRLERILVSLRRDDIAAVQSSLRSSARALGAKRFVTELAHPLALRVGELWGKGELDVRHEHLASACLTRQLHALQDALQEASDDKEQRPIVVLATLPGEHHVLPIDMVAVYLSSSGTTVRVLGADTPPKEIAATARAAHAIAVGVSISAVADREVALRDVRELLGELPRRTELWLGGAGSAPIAREIEDAGVSQLDSWESIEAKVEAMTAIP